MKSKLAIAGACLAVIVICVAAFSFLYRDVHPLGSLRVALDADSAGRKAASLVREIFPQPDLPRREAQLSKNDELIGGVLLRMGHKQGRELLREQIPGYFWTIRWRQPDSGKVEIVAGERDRSETKDPFGRQVGEIQVQLSTTGNLLEYAWTIHDTAWVPSAVPDSTRLLAEKFLRRHFAYIGDWRYAGEKRTERAHRTDIEYSWEHPDSPLGQPVVSKIKMAGSRVLAASLTYLLPSDASEFGESKIHAIVMVFLTIGLGILMIVVAFKRSRAYEMSFRQGVILGILMALLLGIEMVTNLADIPGWTVVFAFLGPLFFGGAFVLIWSVAESVGREAWQEKFTALDLLMKGHVLHSRVGRSLLQGMAIGSAACLVWALLQSVTRSLVPSLYAPVDGETLKELARYSAPLILAGQSLTNNAYLFACLLVFLVSLLRFRFHSAVLLVMAAAIALGIINRGGTTPLGAGIAISTLAALVLSWGFYKFDILTSFISLAAMSLFMVLPAFFTLGNASFMQSGYLLGTGMSALLAFGLVALFTRDGPVDLEAITPAFVKHITERERLQRELEIARDVQMSFLPRQDPVIPGVDIASRCVPALEVGGDYYDFIKLGPDRFGVVVGDVSGKGTQAAFYMTLTKGFLKAVTRASESPARVLTQLNDLFYENVERGTFISMVYGIFDLRRRTVTVARAGHNPPLVQRKESGEAVEFIQPAGLALGLEAGPTFAATIQEFSAELCSGDLYVFYTDGFTEAMNRQKEEYGEERLRRSVEKYVAAGTAADLMNGIFADIREHAGRSKQHDDMTIVVVRT